ncbi:hypothetical protein [Curtobacterium oceanosedimentum]|uniref:hypothetical protein n=1 Tax=Curtobacterium oceanosedimentum TaxID=465820 RepID=UPI003395C17E
MADEIPPSLFNILREDLRALGSRMDHLVTSDTFASERQRIDGKFADQGREIAQERQARAAELAAVRGELKTTIDAANDAREAQEKRHLSLRQGIQIALVTVVGGGVVSIIVLIVQNVAHLR